MSLIDLQRQILSLCFDETPDEAALASLGQREAWLTYREMIRDRLMRELRLALPRTRQLVGEGAFEAAFAHQLAQNPPRTRFFRELVSEFVASALPLWAASPTLHTACGDLARYELTLWEVRDLPAPDEVLNEFSFERVAVVSRALRLLALDHAVHADAALTAKPQFLCIQRPSDVARPKVWVLSPSTYKLLERLAGEDVSASDAIRATAQAAGARIDAAYLDSLCGALAQFLEVGIILGSR